MRIMKLVAVVVVFSCIAGVVSGAVVPYVNLFSIGENLLIPAGKVLIIEQVDIETNRLVDFRVKFNNTGSGIDTSSGFLTMTFSNPTPGAVFSLPVPLRIPGGWSITNIHSFSFQIVGLAVDAADLYAEVGSEIDSLATSAGSLFGGVQLDSPRPVVAWVESTEDLTGWTKDPDGLLLPQDDRTRRQLQKTADGDKEFMRVRARAR